VKVQLSAPAVSAALMFAHAFWGAGYAFGPPRLTSSGSLNRVGSAVAHVLAAAPLVAFVVALAVAQVLGYAEGWGGVLAFVVAAVFHAVLVQARFAPRAGRV
jgi:hypothetical protein